MHRALFILIAVPCMLRAQAAPDWSSVEREMGRAPAVSGGVARFGFPRTDLAVTTHGVTVKPAFALGSWIAFVRMPDASTNAMAMGDLVLTEDELAPVIARLQQGGVQQTAIHHHLVGESPRLFYMHVFGSGDPVAIAQTVHAALALTHTPLGAPPAPAAAAPLDLDTAAIARTLGKSGTASGGVYSFAFPRATPPTMHGVALTPALGAATAMVFQPTGGGKAAITGDFVMTADEVNRVIRALSSHGITPVSLHNHMLDESPRLFFMHFWANDDAKKLAEGLKAGLDEIGK